jgi:hypothetical protein
MVFGNKYRRLYVICMSSAVENKILSPNNTRAEIDPRLKDFFASGAQIARTIDPDNESGEVCHSVTQRTLLGSDAFLDGEHLLPGFRYPIADLFKEWDWD